MKHAAILELEYREQFNQYRWIGQMQAVILTFYGAVTTFSLAATATLRPATVDAAFQYYIAIVLLIVGLIGILVGVGLFKSRGMQRRTRTYLAQLLRQMADDCEDKGDVKKSALRFATMTSTKQEFSFLDTMNIAFLLALLSGEIFAITGIGVLLVAAFAVPPGTILLGATLVSLVVVSMSWLRVPQSLYAKESKAIEEDFDKVEPKEGFDVLSTIIPVK